MNRRTLERIFPALDPPLEAPERAKILLFAEIMAERELMVAGHDRVLGTFRVAFADDSHRLDYTAEEMVRFADERAAGKPFPWAAELARHGYPTE